MLAVELRPEERLDMQVIGASVPGFRRGWVEADGEASVEEVRTSGIGSFMPCLVRSAGSVPSLGDPLLDEYLRFTAARVRPNT
ncbi:hypothetical protein, partial [Nostocoides australiense]